MSRIPLITGVVIPKPLSTVIESIGAVVDLAFEVLPSVACTLGGSFFNRMLLKIATPLVLLFLIVLVHRVRIIHLVYSKMPIDSSMKSWRAKIARALVRSELINSASN